MDELIELYISQMSLGDTKLIRDWLHENLRIQRFVKVRNAVAKYSLFYDEVINWGLRNSKLTQSAYYITMSLINAIGMVPPIPTQITLYRGIRESQTLKLKQLKPGDMFSDKGFSSKTLDFRQSLGFLRGDTCCCLQVEYDVGHKMMALLQSHFKESEFLTVPGEILKILEVYDTNVETVDPDGNPFEVPITIIKCAYHGNLYEGTPFESRLKEIIDPSIDIKYKELEQLVYSLLDDTKNIVTIQVQGTGDLISVTDSKLVDVKQINEPKLVDEAEDYFKTGRLYRDFVLMYIDQISVTPISNLFVDGNNHTFTMTVEPSPGIVTQKRTSSKYEILTALINGTFRELFEFGKFVHLTPKRQVWPSID